MIEMNFSAISDSRIKVILFFLVFILYGNSINNEYSLDDNIVVDGNENVEKGLIGIDDIFTSYHAIDKEQNYGYRPFVLLTFALEKQLFGKLPIKQSMEEKRVDDKLTQANISHFINVLLYGITAIFLFNFLLLLLKDYNKLLPVVITLLFVIHPLHTEPVANIKSRDELLMFLGIILTIISFLKFSFTSKYKYLIYAAAFFLIALLSKKTGLLLFGILPVILYFSKISLKKSLLCVGSLFFIAFFAVGLKQGMLTDAQVRVVKFYENPLFFEGGLWDRISVGLYCSWFYLKMLIFPKDMSFYYGYNQIPMADFSFYQVWLALLFYIPLLVYGIVSFVKREVVGLGIILWLGTMFAYLNIITPVVGIVADRFAYVFSLGFCIVFACLIFIIFKIDFRKSTSRIALTKTFIFTILLVVLAYSARVIIRNPNWHDYLTTYNHDIQVVSNSAKAHSLISNTLYPLVSGNSLQENSSDLIDEMINHYKQAIEIDSTYKTCYNNLGSVYIDFKNDPHTGIYYCQKAIALDDNYLEPNLSLGLAYHKLNVPDSSFKYLMRAVEIDPIDGRAYVPLNNLLIESEMVEVGVSQLNQIALNSDTPKNIYMNIANLYSMDRSNFDKIIENFVKAFNEDENDVILCEHITNLYLKVGDEEKVDYYRSLCDLRN